MASAKSIKLALAQINPTVGDIKGNMALIVECHRKAKGADIVITPELSLIGYPPEDLVLMPSFRRKAMKAVQVLAKQTAKGPALVIGAPWEEKGKCYNAAILLDKGK